MSEGDLSRRGFLKAVGALAIGAGFKLKGEEKYPIHQRDYTACIGADLMAYVSKEGPTSAVLEQMIDEVKPGVFSLFGGNTVRNGTDVSKSELSNFVRGLKQYTIDKHGYEIQIGVDYESVAVNRIPSMESPPNFRLQTARLKELIGFSEEILPNEDKTYYDDIFSKAETAGAQLAKIGIDYIYGPVADIIPDEMALSGIFYHRTMGSDPIFAAIIMREWVRGIQKHGVTCVLKHAPGFGNVGEQNDPHSSGVAIDVRSADLYPYIKLKDGGLLKAVMITHAQIRSNRAGALGMPNEIVSRLPTTINMTFIQYFRKLVGTEVALFSDGMGMRALRGAVGESAVVAGICAVLAGIDVLLFDPPSPDRDNSEVAAAFTEIADQGDKVDFSRYAHIRGLKPRLMLLQKLLSAGNKNVGALIANGLTDQDIAVLRMRLNDISQRIRKYTR